MAKGAFYPELLQMQLYMQDFSEAQAFLRGYHDDLIQPAIEAADRGLPLPSTRFRFEQYSLDQIVAVGSLIHEYVHYLQYTTRNLGLLFYESRFQQYLWTHLCLKDLLAQHCSPRLPLMKWFEEAGSNAPAPLQQWRKEWGAYQAGVSVSGLGPSIGWDDHFGNFVRSEWEAEWFPVLTFEDVDAGGTAAKNEFPSRMVRVIKTLDGIKNGRHGLGIIHHKHRLAALMQRPALAQEQTGVQQVFMADFGIGKVHQQRRFRDRLFQNPGSPVSEEWTCPSAVRRRESAHKAAPRPRQNPFAEIADTSSSFIYMPEI